MQKIKLGLLVILPLLTNCTANGLNGTDFCAQHHAIYTAKGDIITGPTADEIDAYNDYGHALCGWDYAQ